MRPAKFLGGCLLTCAGTAILIITIVTVFLHFSIKEQNTVHDSKGKSITLDLPGPIELPVEWVDRSQWHSAGQEVTRAFYDSLSPAKQACPNLLTDETSFWMAVRNGDCSVIFYDKDRDAFLFIGFVARDHKESEGYLASPEDTYMNSAVNNVNAKFGKQFIWSGRYNF